MTQRARIAAIAFAAPALLIACGGTNQGNMSTHDTTTATTASGDVNANANAAPKAPTDAEIFAVISEANQAEIDAAHLALTKAKHADVKAFAREMIADHTKLLHGGKSLADSLHVTPQPPANDSLATHVSQEKQQLSSVAAPTFDKTYMDAQVQDHETVLALLKQYEGQAQDSRLKTMITKAEPIVQRHLTRAQAVDAKLAAPAA